jgi:3-dehydroquinate synthase
MNDVGETIHVRLSHRSYAIEIRRGLVALSGALLRRAAEPSHAVVVSDENVEQPHARPVAESLGRAGIEVDLVVVPSGEESKSIEVAAQLWQRLLELGADRKSVIVAVGGGVVGDLAGFVAATYARGLRLVQVPTTLLAQVDSSIGGKVGINLPGAKNMVGAFWQPAGVLCDPDVLQTLPEREYRSGLAEVVKYGVILDAGLFAYLEAHADRLTRRDGDALVHAIAASCRLKVGVVEADEREESGLRAVLNYGHTFAHALEAVTGYDQLLHGEAVAIGMMCAARLAARLQRVGEDLVLRQERLLSAMGLPVRLPAVSHESLLSAMAHDKKVEHGRLRFVLPTRLGHVELVGDVNSTDVRAAMAETA